MVIAIYCNLCLVSGSMLLHEVATHRYILLHRCLTGHPLFGVPGIPFYLAFNVEHAGPGYVYVPDRTLFEQRIQVGQLGIGQGLINLVFQIISSCFKFFSYPCQFSLSHIEITLVEKEQTYSRANEPEKKKVSKKKMQKQKVSAARPEKKKVSKKKMQKQKVSA